MKILFMMAHSELDRTSARYVLKYVLAGNSTYWLRSIKFAGRLKEGEKSDDRKRKYEYGTSDFIDRVFWIRCQRNTKVNTCR